MKEVSDIGRIGKLISAIPGWLTNHEGQFLYSAVRSLRHISGAIVEIGSYLGKSTIYLAYAGDAVYAIDPHKGKFSGGSSSPTKQRFLQNLKQAGVESRVLPLIQTSADAHRAWKQPIKLLFIDGLHDERHALEDYTLWSPHLVDGGIVAMHDSFCGWEGSGRVAMRHIVYNPEYGQIGVVGSIIFGVKMKINLLGWIIKLCRQCTIELCQSIYKINIIPKRIQFILVHRFLRLFLINRFTVFY